MALGSISLLMWTASQSGPSNLQVLRWSTCWISWKAADDGLTSANGAVHTAKVSPTDAHGQSDMNSLSPSHWRDKEACKEKMQQERKRRNMFLEKLLVLASEPSSEATSVSDDSGSTASLSVGVAHQLFIKLRQFVAIHYWWSCACPQELGGMHTGTSFNMQNQTRLTLG